MQNRKYYHIDFDRLVDMLLPGFLRKPKMTAFLKACVVPVKTLYQRFQAFSQQQKYEAGITAQAGLIEKALNDAFDPTLRRFQIVHELLNDGPVIFLDSDDQSSQNPIMYLDADAQSDSGIVLHLDSESSELPAGIDFRVKAPLGTETQQEAIRSMVSKYKFASKTFDVQFR
ncbi:hypothetical protein [uncultured Microscilla sp.]|uniref:hypothetical protein n=1 Tax=uncultured Microscilla sp. TaxID=432653 RepID=UPI00260C50CD|nr:hypothetical protein [uncultured Microscilla sp.]